MLQHENGANSAMTDETFKQIFREVKSGKKIDADSLLCLENMLQILDLPYFIMVYVGNSAGGKVICSKFQALDSVKNLNNDLTNLLELKQQINKDGALSKVWD
jgi:hypothetical protein